VTITRLMSNSISVILVSFLFGACLHVAPEEVGDSRLISYEEAQVIPVRHLEMVNAKRGEFGLEKVTLDWRLNLAARQHARDMSAQRRVWHFGSDGSSPIDRVIGVGYRGQLLGENIAETFEKDQQILEAWLRDQDTRATILHPQARHVGIAWKQDADGKIWWVQIVGS